MFKKINFLFLNDRDNLWLFSFIFIFSCVSLLFCTINDQFEMLDFEVYYQAAQRIVSSQELYNIKSDGHYVFHYSPNAGIFFVPLILFPLKIAKYIFWFLLTFILYFGVNSFITTVNKVEKNLLDQKKKNIIVILSLLAVLKHVHFELTLGQVNMLILIVFMFIIKLYYLNKKHLFSILLSITIFIKPFGLIFIPYLVVKKEFKTLSLFLIYFVTLSMLPLLFYSLSDFFHLYLSWFKELTAELNAKQNILSDYNHTIFSVLARFTPIKYLLVNETIKLIYQLLILSIVGIGILKFIQKGDCRQACLCEMIVLISIIPLIAFTNDNAFIFELPIILYLISKSHQMNLFKKSALIFSCALVGLNIYELVGKETMLFLSSISIYTFGTIILLYLIFDLKWKNKITA